MDSSNVLMLLLGVALGTYFNEEIVSAVPLLKRESAVKSEEVLE